MPPSRRPPIPAFVLKRARGTRCSPQVGPNHLDQLLADLRRVRRSMLAAVDHVEPDVFLEHFCEQTVDGAATRRDALQNAAAVKLFVQCTLDCLDLSANPPNPVHELLLFPDRMRHLAQEYRTALKTANKSLDCPLQ